MLRDRTDEEALNRYRLELNVLEALSVQMPVGVVPSVLAADSGVLITSKLPGKRVQDMLRWPAQKITLAILAAGKTANMLAQVRLDGLRLPSGRPPGLESDILLVNDLLPTWVIRAARAATASETPLAFIHGDFVPTNWLWDGTRLAVVDFEWSRTGDPQEDVAMAWARIRLAGGEVGLQGSRLAGQVLRNWRPVPTLEWKAYGLVRTVAIIARRLSARPPFPRYVVSRLLRGSLNRIVMELSAETEQVFADQKPWPGSLGKRSKDRVAGRHRSALVTSLAHLAGFRRINNSQLRLARMASTFELWRYERYEIRRVLASMEQQPRALVVTIIPTYRRPQLLRRAVQSALAQTLTDHRIIVIDDGGGLPSLPTDRRLVAVPLSANCGVAGVVRNIGIGVSESSFIAFLDDDNEWDPNHLEISLAAHSDNTEITYTGLRRVRADGSLVDILSWRFDRKRFRNEGLIDLSSIVVRRKRSVVFSRVPRRKDEFPKEDWELVYRLSRTMPVRHIPIVTVTYLINPDSYFTTWRSEILREDSRR